MHSTAIPTYQQGVLINTVSKHATHFGCQKVEERNSGIADDFYRIYKCVSSEAPMTELNIYAGGFAGITTVVITDQTKSEDQKQVDELFCKRNLN